MRWPLRNQIFVPVAVLLALSVVLVTVVSAWYSAGVQRDQRMSHITSVAASLGDAGFPLTQDVVTRIGGMVGGEVVVLNRQGAVTASTLTHDEQLRESLQAIDPFGSGSLATQQIRWNDQEYQVAVIERTRGARPGTLCVLVPQSEFADIVRESVTAPFTVAIPTLAMALFIALVVSRRISGRVERVQELFASLADGDFQTIPVGMRNDEIRDLMASANVLSAELSRLQRDLIRAERLELLGQLSGGLAHQLRNSITGARLAIQLHEQNCGDDSTGMLGTALAQLRLTEEQVLAVLSLRADGDPETSNSATDVAAMAADVASLLRPQVAHWQSAITVDETGDGFVLNLKSPTSVRGALLNVVMNAVEAAGVGGRVVIRLSAGPAEVTIDVLDSGSGFELESEASIGAFQTTKEGGVGLGLTITRHAVEQESGVLEISRIDGWTSVRMQIPRPEETIR